MDHMHKKFRRIFIRITFRAQKSTQFGLAGHALSDIVLILKERKINESKYPSK